MTKVAAGTTVSVDGYITGPDEGQGQGLGVGGEHLQGWVSGGAWRYADADRGQPTGEDSAWLEATVGANGAVVSGRSTYEASSCWVTTIPGASRCSS